MRNQEKKLHTLVLLDIKIKEQTEEDLIRGRLIFQPSRFMTIFQAAEQLLEAERNKGLGCVNENTIVFAALRVGFSTQKIVVKSLKEFTEIEDFGLPLHSMVIPGEMDEIEENMMKYHKNQSN